MDHSFSEIRSAVRKLHQYIKINDSAEHIYRVNRPWIYEYFTDSRHDRWWDEIEGFANHVRGRDERVIHLDICGNARASRSFDHSYQVSMSHNEVHRGDQVTFYRRDIFDRFALRDLANDISVRGETLTLTTFRPIVGLERYTPFKVDGEVYKHIIHQRLFDQLAIVVNHTRVGGYVYLERPFQFDESIVDFILRTKPINMIGHQNMLKWARRLKCSVRMSHDSFGLKWLLRKDYKELGPIP